MVNAIYLDNGKKKQSKKENNFSVSMLIVSNIFLFGYLGKGQLLLYNLKFKKGKVKTKSILRICFQICLFHLLCPLSPMPWPPLPSTARIPVVYYRIRLYKFQQYKDYLRDGRNSVRAKAHDPLQLRTRLLSAIMKKLQLYFWE